jgi:hypothetical protein
MTVLFMPDRDLTDYREINLSATFIKVKGKIVLVLD